MLLFGALPALGVSAAGETEGVTVTATSNFFPTQTVHLSAEELAEKDNKVTVTYCIRSDEPMVNSQWVVTYSDDVLDVLAEDNTDGTASTIMPNAINGSSCNIKPRGESRIVGNCSNFNGYPLTSESGGKTAFVSVTFRVIGTGEANVDLDLYIFSIRVDNNVIPIVDDGSRTDHPWNGERSADVYSGGYTETDSTLFVSLSATNDAAEGIKTLAPTADATYYALWRSTQRFDWGRDNWNFNNSKARGFFAYSTYRDQISPSYQNVLKKNLTPTAYDIVFTGTSYNKAWLDEEWHGACYGMSSLTLLSQNGYLPYRAYNASATCLHDLSYPKADKNICSLVNYYQMLQANDSIQQHYETTKDKTNDANIKTILRLLSQNEAVLVGYHKDGWGGHSVLAYEYKTGSWTWNGISYQGRIKICDPNNSLGDNEKYYMYLNKNTYYNTYDWAIPAYAYGNVKSVSGAVINYISADPDFINSGGYLSGTTGSYTDNYIARINAYAISNNSTVSKMAEDDGSYVNVNTAPGDIVEDYSYVLSGETKGVLGYKLYDPDAAYRVSQTDAEPLKLTMRYANSYMTGYAQAGYSILFDPTGYIELKGENTDYEIGMTFDDSYPTDWFTLHVSGQASSASLRMAEEGYILTADNLQNVRLRANNTDVSASLLFSTDEKSVFIYEIDETTIGLKINADNNGTYETDLTQSLRKVGDINGDGKLNVRDITALQRCLAEINTLGDDDRAAADINDDGKIDILDVTCLQRYLAEFVTILGR